MRSLQGRAQACPLCDGAGRHAAPVGHRRAAHGPACAPGAPPPLPPSRRTARLPPMPRRPQGLRVAPSRVRPSRWMRSADAERGSRPPHLRGNRHPGRCAERRQLLRPARTGRAHRRGTPESAPRRCGSSPGACGSRRLPLRRQRSCRRGPAPVRAPVAEPACEPAVAKPRSSPSAPFRQPARRSRWTTSIPRRWSRRPRPKPVVAPAPPPPPGARPLANDARRAGASATARASFDGLICGQRVRIQYCEGYWGKVPQCPGMTANPER